MITYKFDEESEYVEYYSKKIGDPIILEILNVGTVKNSEEATLLSEFYWKMVDKSIEDEKSGLKLPWKEGAEFWNEKIMISLSGYLEKVGYENEWDGVVDEQ